MKKSITSAKFAALVDGSLLGNGDVIITGVGKIEEAQIGEITFLGNPKYERFLESTNASCIIVPSDFQSIIPLTAEIISVKEPYQAFLQAMKIFWSAKIYAPIQHESAIIHPSAQIADTAHIGAGVVIGENCIIGENASILPNVVLYNNVKIGAYSVIHANSVCYDDTIIGERCLIHSGAVIGADGFGFVEHKDGSFEKLPQIGNVVIGNDVEIGANTTIDCAAMGSTIIENGVKIDNLIQIGHNSVIGENTGIAAQAGISGSTKIGKRNRIGGQVGTVGHIAIADDVTVVAQSGVSKSIPEKGRYFGSPAQPFRAAIREEMALRQVPDLLSDFRALKKEVEELKKKLTY